MIPGPLRIGRFFLTILALLIAQNILIPVIGGPPFGSTTLSAWLIVGIALAIEFVRYRVEVNRQVKATEAAANDAVQTALRAGLLALVADKAVADKALADKAGAEAPDEAQSRRGDPRLFAAGCQAVLFRQYFPPPHSDNHLSFFGGVPVGPPGLEWPRVYRNSVAVPLHFVMQINCADVPAKARLGLLPDSGILHVFLSQPRTTEAASVRVLYSPASTSWVRVTPPPDLGPAGAAFLPYAWPWALTAADCPPLLPRWPFRPVAVSFTPAVDPRTADCLEDLVPFADRAEKIIAAQGPPLPVQSEALRQPLAPDAPVVRPFAAFPHDWRAVQIAAAAMLREIRLSQHRSKDTPLQGLSEAERTAMLTSLADEAEGWFDKAAALAPHAAVPPEQGEACWQWLARHAWLSRAVLAEAVAESIQASLAASPLAATRIPADIAEAVRSRHALASLAAGFGKVHTRFNADSCMLAMPFDPQGYNSERMRTHLLLLAIAADPSLGQYHGGYYQLWITPADLKARRFDRVELTFDSR